MEYSRTVTHGIRPGEIFEHYKGQKYRIIDVSCHTEDLSWSVVYMALYENAVSQIWHRPLEIFLGTVEIEGHHVPRFRRVE